VEEDLAARFPGAGVIRMDTDTTGTRGAHERLLDEFRRGSSSVLVGTQMVAKGLDIPDVTLVGVLDADLALHTDDYRAAELTFSLITQVVGRAGRAHKPGRALIQTLTPSNPVILSAAAQDYSSFYNSEIELRRLRGCLPFNDMVYITVFGPEESAVVRACLRLRDGALQALQGEYGELRAQLLGPAPEPICRRNNRFHYRLILMCRHDKQARALVRSLLADFFADRQNRAIRAYADLNPD